MKRIGRTIGSVFLILGVGLVSCRATKENVDGNIRIYKDNGDREISYVRVKGVESLRNPKKFEIYDDADVLSSDGRILKYENVYFVLITDDGKFLDVVYPYTYGMDEYYYCYVIKNEKIKRYYVNKDFGELEIFHIETCEGEFFYTKNIDDDSESVFLVLYDDEHRYKKVTETNSLFEVYVEGKVQSGKFQYPKKENLICDTYWKNGEDRIIYIDEETFYCGYYNEVFTATDCKVIYSDGRLKLYVTYTNIFYTSGVYFNTVILYYLLKEDGTLYKLAGPVTDVTDSDDYAITKLRDMNQ